MESAGGCNGWTLVEALVGDQGLELYYDASGAIVGIVQWSSAPPCEGACVPTCLSLPSGAALDALAACAPDAEVTCN